MKKILAIGVLGLLLLRLNSVAYAVDTHNLSNCKISGNSIVNKNVEIYCDYSDDIHNRIKIHYYNRSSEPVNVEYNGRSMTVEPWSGKSMELKGNMGLITIKVKGLKNNKNQVINGEMSVKSWYE